MMPRGEDDDDHREQHVQQHVDGSAAGRETESNRAVGLGSLQRIARTLDEQESSDCRGEEESVAERAPRGPTVQVFTLRHGRGC